MYKKLHNIASLFVVILVLVRDSSTRKSTKVSEGNWWDSWKNDESGRFQNIQYFSDFFKCMENSFNTNYRPHPLIGMKIDEVITFMGYPVETIKVHTEDGYILTMFRIPYSPKSPLVEGQKKKPIYMNHGLSATSQEYLIQWGDRSLAFLLADSGYDVFLVNVRGTTYSSGHVNKTISPRVYWDFSWENVGMSDIPAVMAKIKELTGEQKMYYVGHSMGTTTFMVALSELPELNENIHMAFLMTPAAFVEHASSFIRHLAPLAEKGKYLEQPFLGGKVETLEKILQTSHLKTPFGKLCTKMVADCLLCNNLYFAIGGYDGPQSNSTEVPYIVSVFPDIFSTKSAVHYAQNMAFGTFRRFDYGKEKNLEVYGIDPPKDFELSKITAPVVMLYAKHDVLCSPEDVKYTASKFGKDSIKAMIENEDYTHSDYACAKNARELVYDKILRFMKDHEKQV